MIDLRTFIRNLGDGAPAFFDTKQETINRWVKTGSVPIKAVQKILAAVDAAQASSGQGTSQPVQRAPVDPNIDPLTHLPRDLSRRLPEIQGQPPAMIEISPVEQSFGVNFTRPGRLSNQPTAPMKITTVDGHKVPVIEQPAPVTTLPPEISGDNTWTKAYESKPETKAVPPPKVS